jgi:hypothetical protein
MQNDQVGEFLEAAMAQPQEILKGATPWRSGDTSFSPGKERQLNN